MPTSIELDLSNRVVAITGASSGIGAATARLCAQAGAAVSLAARRRERIEQLAAEVEAGGGRALARATDVTDEAEANAFVTQTAAELGRIDALINNAGVMLLGPVLDAPTDEWRRMIDVNLLGLLYCTHAALPLMQARGSGHIVNISSVAGRLARPGSAVYNMTKWGVGGFSEALRQEVGPAGIKVSVIEPGAVATELVSQNRPEVQESIRARFEGLVPLEAEDIANAVVYTLAQPEPVAINEVLVRPATQTF